MKVLVTGATGFVGSALVRHLLAAHYQVRALIPRKKGGFLLEGLDLEIVNGNVTHPSAVEEAVQGCSIVFHLASIYTFYPFWETSAKALYKVNVQGTTNVLNASLKNGVKRFIHTSSIAAIGKRFDGKPSDETTGFDFKKASHYARSKYMAEQEVLKACRRGLSAVILNPAIVIGERDHKPTPSGDVMVKFLNRNYPGYFDTLWSVADADDVARAHIAAIERGRIGERYILCNERHHTLQEVFQILERISGIPAPRYKIPDLLLFGFVYLDELLSYSVFKKKPLLPTEGVKFCKMSIRYDNAKAVRELGYTSTPIEETLEKAVAWYRKNAYVEPRGIFRVKAHGCKFVKLIMSKLGMDRLTDRLSFGTFSYFFIVKFLQFLKKIGWPAKEEGWRRVTQCYLRTEHSKFALAVFGLDFWSDLADRNEHLQIAQARRHLIERLAGFLRQHPVLHSQLRWTMFSAQPEDKKPIDIVHAQFDGAGRLKSIEPYLEAEEGGITAEVRAALIEGIIEHYNKTREQADKRRPLKLKRGLRKWLSNQSQLIPNGMLEPAIHFIDRALSATFICFERLPQKSSGGSGGRFHIPSFIKCKHPGFGVLNIVCRFSSDLRIADLWVQFSHIPIDGVPAQEILKDIKKRWGTCEALKFPSANDERETVPDLCSTQNDQNGTYHIRRFVDFRSFLQLRRALNKRYVRLAKGNITAAALLIWKLAQFREFADVKFTVPVDLAAAASRPRTLGFVFIRPTIFFDKDKPDRGFFDFQREFNRQLLDTKRRRGESYELIESYALAPPFTFSANLRLMPSAIKAFSGTLGITIIKRADFFVAPSSDVHSEGFIAFSNFSLPSDQGGKVCVVSIKGPKEKVGKYAEILHHLMDKTVKDDELYF